MVRAVTDIVKDLPQQGLAEPERESDVEEYALLAEAVELSNWCHRITDVDISRYNELAQRLQALGRALADQFEDGERSGRLRKLPPPIPGSVKPPSNWSAIAISFWRRSIAWSKS